MEQLVEAVSMDVIEALNNLRLEFNSNPEKYGV